MSFDDQIRAALEGAAANLRQHLEAELRSFAQNLLRAAAEERQRAVTAASQKIAGEVRKEAEGQVTQIRAAAQKHAEDLKRAAEAQIAEVKKGFEELRAQAQQQIDAARRSGQTEVEKAKAEVERLNAEVERANVEVQTFACETEKRKTEAASAAAEVDKWRRSAEEAQAHLQTARAETDAIRAKADEDVGRVRAEADAARQAAAVDADEARQAGAAEAEAAFAARAAAADAISEQKIAEAVERREAGTRQAEFARATQLADAVRTLDQAGGLSDVLERLVQCAAREVDRVAMLIVKGDRLTGWRLAGFSADASPAKSIDLTVKEAGLAGIPVETGVTATRSPDATDGPDLPPFAVESGERHALAMPVHVGGNVVAVLYADVPRSSGTPSSDARWPAILEVLVRHASRVLEAMTVQQAAGLPLQRTTPRELYTSEPTDHAGSGDDEVIAAP